MSTYTQLLYHIVFSTKNRAPSLYKKNRLILYHYIFGILKNKHCHAYCINGVEDHLHILTHIHPTIAISPLVKDIKNASSFFVKQQKLFPKFTGWQNGYGAFTKSIKEKERLIRYVMNQENHHKTISFKEEYIILLKDHGIDFDEQYLI